MVFRVGKRVRLRIEWVHGAISNDTKRMIQNRCARLTCEADTCSVQCHFCSQHSVHENDEIMLTADGQGPLLGFITGMVFTATCQDDSFFYLHPGPQVSSLETSMASSGGLLVNLRYGLRAICAIAKSTKYFEKNNTKSHTDSHVTNDYYDKLNRTLLHPSRAI